MEGDEELSVILYALVIVTGILGIVTIAPLVSELYLYHVLEKVGRSARGDAVLAGFLAINAIITLAFHEGDPYMDPLLSSIIAALTFLVLAIKLEMGDVGEVRWSEPQ